VWIAATPRRPCLGSPCLAMPCLALPSPNCARRGLTARLTDRPRPLQNELVESIGSTKSGPGAGPEAVRLEDVLRELGIPRRTFEEWRRRGVLPRTLNPAVRRGSRPGGGRGGSISTWPDTLRGILWFAQLVSRATRNVFGRAGSRRRRWKAQRPSEHTTIRCALWALGEDYDLEVIRQDLIRFNEVLKRLTLGRGSMKFAQRTSGGLPEKPHEDAISDLVESRREWFRQVRKFIPGFLPRPGKIQSELVDLLVGRDGRISMLDKILQAVRTATPQHFELARRPLALWVQGHLGLFCGLLARRGLGIASTEEEEVALKLCKKELGCVPVYAAAFVYLAVRQPGKLEKWTTDVTP
jgi:hypothetical protein